MTYRLPYISDPFQIKGNIRIKQIILIIQSIQIKENIQIKQSVFKSSWAFKSSEVFKSTGIQAGWQRPLVSFWTSWFYFLSFHWFLYLESTTVVREIWGGWWLVVSLPGSGVKDGSEGDVRWLSCPNWWWRSWANSSSVSSSSVIGEWGDCFEQDTVRSNKWTSESMNDWRNERMNEWMNEQMNELMNEWMNE